MSRSTGYASAFFVVGIAGLVGIGLWSYTTRLTHKTKPNLPMPSLAVRTRQTQALVDKYKDDPNPKAQDLVGEAEMRLAYFDAGKHDFAASRKKFLEATKIKGTGAMAADFGGINDQAAYQAVVCLIPQHKEDEAKAEFRAFMKDHPLSPLVHGAFKRLLRLNNGKSDPNDEALLQTAVTAQEKHIAFETSVCGPKTVEYLLKEGLIRPFPLAHLVRNGRGGKGGEGAPNPGAMESRSNGVLPNTREASPNTQHLTPKAACLDYRALATLFGATTKGTTMMAMRKGLRKLGIETYGLKLNRRDFAKLPTPAIMLSGDHYLALLEIHERKALVYDSRFGSTQTLPLPALDTSEFSATVLSFTRIQPDDTNPTGGTN